MKQVTQTLGNGEVLVQETPVPTLSDKFVLVKNRASVISAGTEKSKIDMGKKNLLQKAKARPDQVKQVLDKLKKEGWRKTLDTVKSRLSNPEPLGYSCTGDVLAIGGMVEGLRPGQRVACGGAGYANHAEVVAVPKNLVVPVPDNVTDDEAAFTTVGAIAMQGMRLAQPMLGETFLVLGLGLLGQIMVQLLRANGCQVIATDLDPNLVERAKGFGAIGTVEGIEELCMQANAGAGVDGVLICAGTSSNQPVEMSGRVTREKGRVVVVGAVRMDIPREDYFKKEISVVISRSYGPGRYDPFYEEQGNDYPLGYVRFSEQRNMQSFLQLLSEKKVDVSSLITHHFDIEQANDAYGIIEGEKKEPYLGILLHYAHEQRQAEATAPVVAAPEGKMGISFLGAGNYATASLLPKLKSDKRVALQGIATASGRTATSHLKQFGFQYSAEGIQPLLGEDSHALMITTRHDTHAASVIEGIKANKNVYVEKPLAMSVAELLDIRTCYQSSGQASLMVGFNRRFAPSTRKLQAHFEGCNGPKVINIRVNAGFIDSSHWIQDPEVGGGRIIGEACHFIDLAACITGSHITRVSAFGARKPQVTPILNDNLVINLEFADGSVATVTYTSEGNKGQNKELIEVFCAGKSAVIDDFRQVQLYDQNGALQKANESQQNKGQAAMLEHWLDACYNGQHTIDFDSLFNSSLATILAVESLSLGTIMSTEIDLPHGG